MDNGKWRMENKPVAAISDCHNTHGGVRLRPFQLRNKLIWKCFIMLLIIIFSSCGYDIRLKPFVPPGYIFNVSTLHNILSFETQDSTFVKIYYQNIEDNLDNFRGWTAGDAAKNHTYLLPVNHNELVTYQMDISVFKKNDNLFRADTTITFSTVTNQHDLLKVHFIDVKQGDSMFIQTPDGKNMMIDGGWGRRGRSLSQGSGVPIALNYLTSLNIAHLDYIIETHYHGDHYGGLDDIVRSHITYDYYISNSNKHGFAAGDVLYLGQNVRFDFYNFDYPVGVPRDNINNTSVVLKMTYEDADFLFTGDIDGNVQNWMYEQNYDLSVDVLKASHHGSSANRTSDEYFLSQTMKQFAQIVILSFGSANGYGHPADIFKYNPYYTYGTNLAHTLPSGNHRYFDDVGHIIIHSDGKMIFLETERK